MSRTHNRLRIRRHRRVLNLRHAWTENDCYSYVGDRKHLSFPVSTQHYFDRVIQGSPITIAKYPIVAQLLLDAWGSGEYVQHCAGTILTSKHVMSAAHCFQYNTNTGRK